MQVAALDIRSKLNCNVCLLLQTLCQLSVVSQYCNKRWSLRFEGRKGGREERSCGVRLCSLMNVCKYSAGLFALFK